MCDNPSPGPLNPCITVTQRAARLPPVGRRAAAPWITCVGGIAFSPLTPHTGKPFNIASYALLTHMVAQQCDLAAGEFIWTGGDCHLYLNHLDQVEAQLARAPFPLPRLVLERRPPTLFDYGYDDIAFVDYQSHPSLKAPVAI